MKKEKEIAPFVLIVDDDIDLHRSLVRQFGQFQINAVGVADFSSANRVMTDHYVNLLILNTEVGGLSGCEFLRQLQRNSQFIPTIFVVNQHIFVDRAKLLEYGDDVMQKPIHLNELVARIRAILRRSETSRDWHLTENVTLNDGDFDFCGAVVSPQHLMLTFPDGQRELVGKKEVGLMGLFAKNAETIISRRDVIHRIWGLHANLYSRSLDQYVVKIRNLFRAHGYSTTNYLRTIHGVGYRYSANAGQENRSFLRDVSQENGPLVEAAKPSVEHDTPAHDKMIVG